ncbi:hypothetical protein [Streptomyces sp. NPDC058773]|uniref:hypothetical protein n=1 Tax=Streptomyces sp. NPDC058773 TaxID=3346632 RepID=UPI003698E94A
MKDGAQAAQNNQGAAQVQVQLTGCLPEDAHTVFTVLDTLFVTDRAKDDAPRDPEGAGAGAGAAVWSAIVDVSADAPTQTTPHRLTGPVTATVQGGYWAADRLRTGLGYAFSVRDVGSTSGDQEQEIQLRVDNRVA